MAKIIFSSTLGQRICDELAEGRTLREALALPGMPTVQTVYRWLSPGHRQHKPEFLKSYRIAKMWQADAFVERLLEVARDASLPSERRKAEMDALKLAAARATAKSHLDDGSGELVVRVVYEDQEIPAGASERENGLITEQKKEEQIGNEDDSLNIE